MIRLRGNRHISKKENFSTPTCVAALVHQIRSVVFVSALSFSANHHSDVLSKLKIIGHANKE